MQFDSSHIVPGISSLVFLGIMLKMHTNGSKRDKNLYDYINKKADEGDKDHVHKDVYKSDIKNIEYRLDNIDSKQDKIYEAITKRNGGP